MKQWLAYVASVGLSAAAVAAEPPTCEQIREQIRAQTGVSVQPDADLLRTLAARQDCRFSAAEVYRAAYGDRPIPRNHDRGQERRHRKWHDDD